MAKDILKATLDEWDRIVVRPYREIEQLQVNITCFVFSCEDAALQVLMSVRLSVCGQFVILPIPRFPKVSKGYPRLPKVA